MDSFIKRLRVKHNITQEDLLNGSDISAVYLSQIELGKRPITLSAARQIIKHFHMKGLEYELSDVGLLSKHVASFYNNTDATQIEYYISEIESAMLMLAELTDRYYRFNKHDL